MDAYNIELAEITDEDTRGLGRVQGLTPDERSLVIRARKARQARSQAGFDRDKVTDFNHVALRRPIGAASLSSVVVCR